MFVRAEERIGYLRTFIRGNDKYEEKKELIKEKKKMRMKNQDKNEENEKKILIREK